MTPERLVLILLVGVGAVLTVVLLGCLRSLADVRLELASAQRRRVSGDALAAGRPIPDFLAAELPWLRDDGLVLFISADCPLCTELVSLLPQIRIPNIAFAVLGESQVLRDELVRFGVVLPDTTARDAADQFALDHFPTGVLQRDGVIIGSIHTEALVSVQEIERFWTFGGARLTEAAA